MRLAAMATEPHEARENDGWPCRSAESVEHGGAAVKEHWYHPTNGHINHPFVPGGDESDAGKRTRRPVGSKRETRYTGSPDWRGVSIVSLTFSHFPLPPSPPSLQSFCHFTVHIVLLPFSLFVVIHSFFHSRPGPRSFLLPTFVAPPT